MQAAACVFLSLSLSYERVCVCVRVSESSIVCAFLDQPRQTATAMVGAPSRPGRLAGCSAAVLGAGGRRRCLVGEETPEREGFI